MKSLLILLAAMFVVVGGVLFLKLHAALALLLAAIVTALLTPATSVYEHEITRSASRII